MVDDMLLMGRQVGVTPKSSSATSQKSNASNVTNTNKELPPWVNREPPIVKFVRHIQERGRASDPTLKKAKGGKIDGIAIRGKTRAKRKK
jgi:hypothetical protein